MKKNKKNKASFNCFYGQVNVRLVCEKGDFKAAIIDMPAGSTAKDGKDKKIVLRAQDMERLIKALDLHSEITGVDFRTKLAYGRQKVKGGWSLVIV